jgi:type II secretory pathway predicted ATPase ExeA
MRYTVERRQFALFTGEVGADKSTAARLLTDSLHPARYLVLHITDSDFTPRNFYYEALHQLGHLPRSIFIGRKPPLRKMFILN